MTFAIVGLIIFFVLEPIKMNDSCGEGDEILCTSFNTMQIEGRTTKDLLIEAGDDGKLIFNEPKASDKVLQCAPQEGNVWIEDHFAHLFPELITMHLVCFAFQLVTLLI